MDNRNLDGLVERLFDQMDALSIAKSSNAEAFEAECKRAEKMCGLSEQIISAGHLNIKAASVAADFGAKPATVTRLLS